MQEATSVFGVQGGKAGISRALVSLAARAGNDSRVWFIDTGNYFESGLRLLPLTSAALRAARATLRTSPCSAQELLSLLKSSRDVIVLNRIGFIVVSPLNGLFSEEDAPSLAEEIYSTLSELSFQLGVTVVFGITEPESAAEKALAASLGAVYMV